MRVTSTLRRLLEGSLSRVHATRLEAIFAVVAAVIRVGRLSVSAVGRGIQSPVAAKHSIKRADRLLSNLRFAADRLFIFRSVATLLLERSERVVILIDWTHVADDFHALVAAVPALGRALPIYFEVHPESLQNNGAVESTFLRRLRLVLPPGCAPIIVTDAGFRGPFFRAVLACGWDFIGRLRGHVAMQLSDGRIATKDDLCAIRDPDIQDLGRVVLYPSGRSKGHHQPTKPTPARVVLAAARRQDRPKRTYANPTSRSQRKTIRGARERSLLATSLGDPPATVLDTYAKRMRIEETFRDAKNHRWGWSLRHVRCGSAHRTANLLTIAMLATWVVTLVGADAERRHLHRRYQANTVSRRVLSLFALGAVMFRRSEVPRLRWRPVLASLRAAGSVNP